MVKSGGRGDKHHNVWCCRLSLVLAVVVACSEPPRLEEQPCPRWSPTPTLELALDPRLGEPYRLPVDARPLRDGRWLVAEQSGAIYLENAGEKQLLVDLGAQIADPLENWEWGLLSAVLHPSSGRLLVWLTEPSQESASGIRTVLASYPLKNGTARPESRVELLSLEQPGVFHQGGHLLFDDAGHLYLSTGDGGFDHRERAADPNGLFGKILRFSVDDSGETLSVPTDNPFDSPIFASGFRNPWRLFLDGSTLWVADVGENAREEVSRVVAGGNYGWPSYEGTRRAERHDEPAAVQAPITEYCRDVGQAVTGGVVYRGEGFPELFEHYVFADFVTGRVMAVPADASPGTPPIAVGELPGVTPGHLVLDRAGEIVVVDRTGGRLHSLVRGESAPPPPSALSDTVWVAGGDPTRTADAGVPYQVRSSFYSEGFHKTRALFLPADSAVERGADGDLSLPIGAALLKSFWVEPTSRTPFETRVLLRDETGWRGYSYRWEGHDARLLEGRLDEDVAGRRWTYPSRSDCMRCHTRVAGVSLGLSEQNLVPSSELEAALQFSLQPSRPLASLADSSEPVSWRVRSYLDTNCAMCHQPSGPGGGAMDLRAQIPVVAMNVCDVSPAVNDFGIEDARLLAPGAPERSILHFRSVTSGPSKMHPFRHGVDNEFVALLETWINESLCAPR